MNRKPSPILAILAQRPEIPGDEALLHLSRRRFIQAGLGAEFYPDTPEHLAWLRNFRPGPDQAMAHLPRGIDLFDPAGRDTILAFAGSAGDEVRGLVIHDSLACAQQPEAAVAALTEIDRRLGELPQAPYLFFEYAAGLAPEVFADLLNRCASLPRIAGCLDVGHVGLWICRDAYATATGGEDISTLSPTAPDLANKRPAWRAAMAAALPLVKEMIACLAGLDKPLHFHLHDAHPLFRESPWGVSDHLSFLHQVVLPGPEPEGLAESGLYGPAGLREIVAQATAALPPEKLSFTLEIHPHTGRQPLDAAQSLFPHWQNLENAERHNFWLDELIYNSLIFKDLI